MCFDKEEIYDMDSSKTTTVLFGCLNAATRDRIARTMSMQLTPSTSLSSTHSHNSSSDSRLGPKSFLNKFALFPFSLGQGRALSALFSPLNATARPECFSAPLGLLDLLRRHLLANHVANFSGLLVAPLV